MCALPLGTGRNLSRRVAAAEALQLIGGFSDPSWLCKISPQFEKYREDAGGFWGAYGNRVQQSGVQQLKQVVAKLDKDPTTRQAVVTLWDPVLDNVQGKKDYPCTVAFNFRCSGRLYRQHNRLDMHVLMRSNDAWLGLPYDMFQFTQLQLTLCNVLQLEPGKYTHHAWSLHLYLTNLEESYDVTDYVPPNTVLDKIEHPIGVGILGQDIQTTINRAGNLAHGIYNTADMTTSERWYLDVLDGNFAS